MWNGFWKLTVMVGVIGVGLFAVYQAQQGMNRVASVSPVEESNDADESDPSVEPTSIEDDAPTSVSIHRLDQKQSALKKPRPIDSHADDRIDLVGRFNSDKPPVKTAMGTKSRTDRQVAAVDLEPRSKGLSFREEIELVELDESEPPTEAPLNLPEDGEEESLPVDSEDESKKMDQEANEAEADSVPEKSSGPEAAFDPFDEDPPSQKPETPAPSAEEDSVTEEPATSNESAQETEPSSKAAPRKQVPSTPVLDFGHETDIPRSKRATSGKEKKPEPPAIDAPSFEETPDEPSSEKDSPAEVDLLPFGSQTKSKFGSETKSKSTLPEPEAAVEDDFPAKDAPESFEELTTEEDASDVPSTMNSMDRDDTEPDSDPMPALGSPASDRLSNPPSLFPDEDEAAKSPPPAKKRLTLPGLSVEPDQEPTERGVPTRKVPEPEMFERDVPERNVPERDAVDREESDREPFRGRESTKRRVDPDNVTPGDLVGDGIAGDASQRGVQQPRLTIEKVAQHQAVLDQPLIYTIIVRNTGNVVAHNVVVEDRIPKGTELMGTSPRAELVGKRLIWNELVLKPNEEKKISIKVIPKQEGPIGSVARLYFATEVTAEIQVATPQLEFTLKAPQEVRPGQTIDLVFHLKNVGTVDASNIIVRDLIPENFKHEEGTDIECAIGKLSPNEVREIVLPITAMTTGEGINRAVLTADSGIKKELDQSINVIGEVLVLTRSGHNRVYVARPATFTSNIRNDGNQRVANVRVAEVVPAGMEFETASEGGRYDAKQRAVYWTLGPLGPGDDRAVSVKYVPKETGTHVGKITATGASGSTASVDATVEVVGRPELQMESLSTTGVVTVGDRISSKMQLKNSGTAPARNVRLSLRLPPELRLVEVRGRKCQQKNDLVIFETIEELPPRGNVAFELMLEPTHEAEAKIQLEISAEHLTKPHRRDETIQIVQDNLK